MNLINQRFGRLVVRSFAGKRGPYPRWQVECDCGNFKVVDQAELRRGRVRSCGCLAREVARENVLTHGMSDSYEFSCWRSMRRRCYYLKHPSYHNYGGRGIRVCDRWRDSFTSFLSDMGCSPSPRHELDRIDNDGDYSPGNCRWVDRATNSRNRRSNRIIEFNGISLCIAEWAEVVGIHRNVIQLRLASGWTVQKTLTEPLRITKRSQQYA